MEFECETYDDNEEITFCNNTTRPDMRGVAVTTFVDLVITTFLLSLFVVPLRRVANTNLGQLNDRQKESRRKLRSLLIWSVILAFINLGSSVLLKFAFAAFPTPAMKMVIAFDPAVNVWTSWLMTTRNQHFMKRLLCECKVVSRKQIFSTFTERRDSSRSNTRSKRESNAESTQSSQIQVSVSTNQLLSVQSNVSVS